MLSVRPSRRPSSTLSLHTGHHRVCKDSSATSWMHGSDLQSGPSVQQLCGSRRGGARVISPAPEAHQNGRPGPCQLQKSCPACRAAQCWPHNSIPLRVIEREVVRAGSAHIVCDLCTEHVGIAMGVENDA